MAGRPIPCIDCGKTVIKKSNHPAPQRCNACYRKHNRGPRHPKWKGGTTHSSNGYVLIRCPDHPNRMQNDYVFMHRYVMEQHLERFLKPEEVVHHINGNKEDNRIENLVLCQTESEHQSRHHKSPPTPCKQCGKMPKYLAELATQLCYNCYNRAWRRKIRPVPWGPKVK